MVDIKVKTSTAADYEKSNGVRTKLSFRLMPAPQRGGTVGENT
jgi:hypothetical protein